MMHFSVDRPDAWRGLAAVIVCLLVLAGGAADARAQALFPGQEYPTGGGPAAIAVRNVNGDSTFDVIVTNYNENTVAVLLTDRTGQLGPPTTFPTGAGPGALAIGDVNGDRNLDAVVAEGPDQVVAVMLGDGAGRFAPAVRFAVGERPTAVALGDVDRDGNLDIVVASVVGANVSVLRGDGAGGFAAAVASLAPSTETVAVADVTGDAKPDLVVSGGGKVSLLRGDGAGGFGDVAELAAGRSPRVGDVTGDGRPDIVFAPDLDAMGDRLSVLPADGAGWFGPPIVSTIGATTGPEAIADVNGDGRPDVLSGATVTGGGGDGSVALGDGTGRFARRIFVSGVSSPAAVGDLNGDGRPDVASLVGGNVAVRLADGAQGLAAPGAFGVEGGAGPVTVGDVNRDGKRDLLTSSDGVSVLLGDGAGGFADAAKVADVRAQIVGDVNGDGVPDLVSFAGAGQGVAVRLGDGSAGFGDPIASATGSLRGDSALGDLNGDGNTDLVVADELASRVLVLFGDGSGRFAPGVAFGTAGRTGALAIADVNADGRPDIVAANSAGTGKTLEQGGGGVAVLLGDGRGGFAKVAVFAAGVLPFGLAVGDVNGDGRPDALVATGSAVSVLAGDGTGRFGPPATFRVHDVPVAVAIADLSGDGRPDLVSANSEGNDVSVLYGDGAGRFAPAVSFATGAGPGSVRVSDLNGDGRPDLAVANTITRDVAVLLNRGPVTATGPFGTGGLPAPGLPPAAVRHPAKLQVFRAGIKGRRLDVLASITGRATGILTATYRNHGTITSFTVKIPASGPVRISKALSAKARKGHTGILTLTYNGNARVRSDDVRLRAASGKARLMRKVARIDSAGNLRVSGTINRKARGVVRVRFTYVEPDGQARRLYTNATITRGRWAIKRALPAAAQAAGGQASIQYTGYLKARIRGEQDAKAIAGHGR